MRKFVFVLAAIVLLSSAPVFAHCGSCGTGDAHDHVAVEATLKVGTGVSNQYHQLLTENSGNYINTSGQLRIHLPKNIHMMGRTPKSRIMNQNNETVWEAGDLISGIRGETYALDDYGRLIINIAALPGGYYVFELTTENNRAYFFRFQVDKSNGKKRN